MHVDEIDPNQRRASSNRHDTITDGGQSHQHFTQSYYAGRSQKRKKCSQAVSLLRFRDLCPWKLGIKCWWNWPWVAFLFHFISVNSRGRVAPPIPPRRGPATAIVNASLQHILIFQVSISSTLYARVFRMNVVFSSYIVSCQNDVRTKNSYVERWWNWRQDSPSKSVHTEKSGGSCFKECAKFTNPVKLLGAYSGAQRGIQIILDSQGWGEVRRSATWTVFAL
jgi:hypothetical protein